MCSIKKEQDRKCHMYGRFSCVLLPGFGSKTLGGDKQDNGPEPDFFIKKITMMAAIPIFIREMAMIGLGKWPLTSCDI